MSKAGERLIRSARQALAHARGEENEETRCLVIPADVSKEERLRLIEEWMGQDDEDGDSEHLAEEPAVNSHRSGPAASHAGDAAAQPLAAASRKAS